MRIAVAFSGGVDSSSTALMLKNKGHDIIAVTMKLKKPGHPGLSPTEDAQIVEAAQKIGIEHQFLDLTNEFENEVLRYSWNEYSKGRTPNPCAVCNPLIKFGKLLKFAEEHGASHLATGHYARIKELEDGSYALCRGTFTAKDQSYFLFALSKDMLPRILMPLGEMTKEEVRTLAREYGLPNADKKESQDACFTAPDEIFSESLRNCFSAEARQGFFVDEQGKKLGRHEGFHLYTIGQRKGLKIALGKPAYVLDLDNTSGNVTLSTNEKLLFKQELIAENTSWLLESCANKDFRCEVQIRYRSRPAPAEIIQMGNNRVKVIFETAQRAITPGQAAVFYKDDRVLGGAWIV